MIQWFVNLRLIKKLAVLVGVMGIPVLVVAAAYFQLRSQTMATLNKEKETLVYYETMPGLIRDVGAHRALNARVLAGDASARSQLASTQQLVEAHFATLQRLEDTAGRNLNISQDLSALRQGWTDLTQKAGSMSLQQSFDAHGRLITQTIALIAKLGDAAVILEPDLDAYHLSEPLVVSLPELLDAIGRIQTAGTTMMSRKVTAEERLGLAGDTATTRYLLGKIRGGMNIGFTANRLFNTKISPEMVRSNSAVEAFLQQATELAVAGEGPESARAFFDQGASASDAVIKFYATTVAAFNENLDNRLVVARNELLVQVALLVGGIALAIVLAVLITGTITRQSKALTELFSTIGMGDFAARAKVHGEDELGVVTQSLNAMLDNLLSLVQSQDEKDRLETSIQQLVADISTVAQGDLTAEAKVSSETTGAIADSVNQMIGHLRDVISRVHVTTEEVSSSAGEVQATAEHLAEGSEHQAAQIGEASIAIDDVAASIQQVAANALTAATVADRAQQLSKVGAASVHRTIQGMNGIREQVQQTAKRIKRLGESSQEIGEIVQLINGISDRTSILALNASVQAAAAGEAGKAFAVVAEEVEALAERSAEATKRIASLIKSIQTETSHAVAAMEETTKEVVGGSGIANEAGQRLAEIEQVSTQLAELIQSISMAAKQQTRGSESVAKTIGDISGITQQTAAGAKQAAVSIRRLAELANELRSGMDRFKLPA